MFLSMEIAKQSMMNNQLGVNVSMHNLSNVGNADYSKQSINVKTAMSINVSGNYLGTGAYVASIYRNRSGIFDSQYRSSLGSLGSAYTKANSLTQINSILGEMDETNSLKNSMNNLFDSIQELSKNPENVGIKTGFKDTALALSNTFNQMGKDLKLLKEQASNQAKASVDKVNSLLENIQLVNTEIGKLTVSGTNPNDLLDKRDAMIDELSKIMDINIVATDNNKINVVSNGHVLVQDSAVSKLNILVANNFETSITYSNGDSFKSTQGELAATLEIISKEIPTQIAQLNRLAVTIKDEMNTIFAKGKLQDGTTPPSLFVGDDIFNISVNDEIIKDPNKIPVSSDGEPGNNDILLELADLKTKNTIDEMSIDSYFDSILSNSANKTNAAISKFDSCKKTSKEILKMRTSETGVSTNEELLNVQKYQQSFAAASKVIQTVNSMMDSLLQIL